MLNNEYRAWLQHLRVEDFFGYFAKCEKICRHLFKCDVRATLEYLIDYVSVAVKYEVSVLVLRVEAGAVSEVFTALHRTVLSDGRCLILLVYRA